MTIGRKWVIWEITYYEMKFRRDPSSLLKKIIEEPSKIIMKKVDIRENKFTLEVLLR